MLYSNAYLLQRLGRCRLPLSYLEGGFMVGPRCSSTSPMDNSTKLDWTVTR